MSSSWRMGSKERQALMVRLSERRLEDKDYDVLSDMLHNGVDSMEKLMRRERSRNAGRDEAESKTRENRPARPKKKKKGHGRISFEDYTGAKTEFITHETLRKGEQCPDCGHGKLFELDIPAKLVSLMASSPVQAIRYLKQRLRCSGCQSVFVAKDPEKARYGKYHPSANAAVTISKYGLGVPFKRLEQWQKAFGIPLPDATQYEMTEQVGNCCFSIFKSLEHLAADFSSFFADDTNYPILSLLKENKTLGKKDRHGMRATGILARDKGRDIYLFYLGRQHSGENLGALLDKRSPGLPDPIQMGDASSCNTKHGHNTVICFCSSHAVRKFKTAGYPEYTGKILELLKAVFDHDAETRKKNLSDNQRLAYHQKHSATLMKKLRALFTRLVEEKLVEPRSPLAAAINYMTKRWRGFTRFLEVPGAPLDNNIIERALKMIIRVRKNAGFFKNDHGAFMGSIIFSVLTTAVAAGANPMDYLTEIQIHQKDVRSNPELWFPWNYRARIQQLQAVKGPTRPVCA